MIVHVRADHDLSCANVGANVGQSESHSPTALGSVLDRLDYVPCCTFIGNTVRVLHLISWVATSIVDMRLLTSRHAL